MSKTDWTPEDLKGSGQYLVRTEKDHIQDTGFLSTIMVKVMYTHMPHKAYGLCSMSDGWTLLGQINRENKGDDRFTLFKSMQDLCDNLNRREKTQRFRPATQEEVMRVILKQIKRCFVKNGT